jgi:ketosteroid isomerase-like protein
VPAPFRTTAPCLALTLILVFALTVCRTPAAIADTASDVKSLYDRFLAAQNARDLDAVRQVLLPTPEFQWVSDGKSFWGADELVQRMSQFQNAEVWQVTPDYTRSRVVEVATDAAYLYQPLTLRIGPAAKPSEIPFLVNVLSVRTAEGWRIAALFTTTEKP